MNATGAAGTIGLARFVTSDAGNPDALLVTGLVMVSGIAANQSPVTLADVTPIARLSGEYEVIVVPAASPHRTLADLMAAFRANPRAISWGGGSAGGTDELLVRLVAGALDVPQEGVNYIAYSGGGQALAAILGGHVSAGVSGLGEFGAHIESGALRALAISAPRGAPVSGIPALADQGIPVALLNWRGVVAPPGITRAERRSLEQLVETMTQHPSWKAAMARNGWEDITMVGEPFDRFIRDETRRVAPLVAPAARGARGPARDWFGLIVLVGSLAAIAIAIAVSVAARRRALRQADDAAPSTATTGSLARNNRAVGLVAAALVLNAGLIVAAGFVVAAAATFALVARAFGSRRPLVDAGVGIALAATIHALFTRGLGVTLPPGPF